MLLSNEISYFGKQATRQNTTFTDYILEFNLQNCYFRSAYGTKKKTNIDINNSSMREHPSNIVACNWILTTNFTFLVKLFCLILTFIWVSLHHKRIFPEACAKILLLLVYSWYQRFAVSIQPLLCVVFNIPCLTSSVFISTIVKSFFQNGGAKNYYVVLQ